MVYQSEISAMDKRVKLSPPNPNRAAAHKSNGRGTYSAAGIDGDNVLEPNIATATSTVLSPKRTTSEYRAAVALRIQEIPFEPQSTITGTIVSAANALVQNRSSPSGQ
jgi:hypothetical protein